MNSDLLPDSAGRDDDELFRDKDGDFEDLGGLPRFRGGSVDSMDSLGGRPRFRPAAVGEEDFRFIGRPRGRPGPRLTG